MQHSCTSKNVVIHPTWLHPSPHNAATLHGLFLTEILIRKGHIACRNVSKISVQGHAQESGQILSAADASGFSAPKGFHMFRILKLFVLHVVWAISAEMAHVTLAAKRLDLTSAPVLICTGINSFSRIPALNGEREKQTLPDSQTCVVCPWLYLKIHATHPHWSLNTKTAGTRLS
eukprot:s2730_g6.t1